MRLKHINLAGFKSFVDPTKVPFPKKITVIVGPNGCGKSNVIDAVRWVMGESSAKNLRGESLVDVIFNGSTGRKPVGQATIELVFDNSDGTLGGEYASYAEISVKRQLTRDGQSTYFLNNAKCRRRDITDVFLGTGLGPRSYAIIEQGTISRLIEAKPEELRQYLEEVAGISKYKERRRETETRIRHTRENLERLSDVRQELEKQLSHLKRQSAAAERFNELKTEAHQVKGQLYILRHRMLTAKSDEYQQTIAEREVGIEAANAELTRLMTNSESQRESQIEAADQLNAVQERYYQTGSQIARLEQTLKHHRERQQQLAHDQAEVQRGLTEHTMHREHDQETMARLQAELAELAPEAEAYEEQANTTQEHWTTLDAAMHQWQVRWDDFNQHASTAQQDAQVSQARIQHLEERIAQISLNLRRKDEELQKLESTSVNQEIERLEELIEECAGQSSEQQEQLASLQYHIQQDRQTQQRLNTELSGLRTALQQEQGKQSSLQALQRAALGTHNERVVAWLKEQGLDQKTRLAQQLRVEAGWEMAVETVLSSHLEAICVDDLAQATRNLPHLEKGQLSFISKKSLQSTALSSAANLAQKVSSEFPVEGLLAHIYLAHSESEARQHAEKLQAHESVITQEGLWLGPNWVRLDKATDATSGVIVRERELKDSVERISAIEEQIEALMEVIQSGQTGLQQKEQERERLQQTINTTASKLADFKAQVRVQHNRLEHVKQRQIAIESEKEEQDEQRQVAQEELQETRQTWQEALGLIEEQTDERNRLLSERETMRQNLDQARDAARRARDLYHQTSLKIQGHQAQVNASRQNLTRVEQQLVHLKQRQDVLEKLIQENEAPIEALEQHLEDGLEQRLAVETELQAARKRLETIDHELRTFEQQRQRIDATIQRLKQDFDTLRMQHQEIQIRSKTLLEQLEEMKFDVELLQQTTPTDLNVEEQERHLNQIEEKIQRLGPINLAAIDEFQTQSERKNYLDIQNTDLEEALATLERAMQKIDKETRTRFEETFNAVNNGMQVLFPKIFGGGRAYLELTGDDLLNTGVAVMAQPPGKRNSTIHLLSGGEKALTAMSLVFSLFQLNPAPFCMLDEVDAPLDEANVGRFCNLVREMSEKVQFIVISHNKVTMEMADHLAGVTMHEPGVSRLVAVDVDAALALAGVEGVAA